MAEGEAALVARLRAGEEQAFEELIRLHGGAMRFAARRLLRHEADADEVLQEALLAALRSIDDFRGEAQLGTWLRRIAVNHALMRLRTRGSRDERSLEELLPRFMEGGAWAAEQTHWAPLQAAAQAGPQESAMRNEVFDCVRAAIELLPDSLRTVLVLRELEGYSNEDIAEQLTLSVNATKLRVHRGRQLLRELLGKKLGALPA